MYIYIYQESGDDMVKEAEQKQRTRWLLRTDIELLVPPIGEVLGDTLGYRKECITRM